MININDNLEDVICKILDVASRPELIGMYIGLNPNEFYIYDVYLDNCEDSDDYSFDWIIGKPFRLQSKKTRLTLEQLFFIDPITI